MKRNEIWAAVELELRSAKKKHPNYPDHVCGQAGIVVEEAGELMRAALDWKYGRAETPEEQHGQLMEMQQEAIQTAASCIRFLENIGKTKTKAEEAKELSTELL